MQPSSAILALFGIVQLCAGFRFNVDQTGSYKLARRLEEQLKPSSAGRLRLGAGTAARRATAGNTLGQQMFTKRGGATSGRKAFLNIVEAPPKTISARQHGSAILECSASGNPAPTLVWYKNGQPLMKEADYYNEKLDEGLFAADSMSETKSRVSLECLTEADAGVYECVASNQEERVVVTTEVNVESYSGNHCAPRHSHSVDISPPRVYQWMGTYMQAMGSDAHLVCRADGAHTTGWIAPDMNVISEENPKYRILSNGDLIIHDLSFNDMGMFKCIAGNDNGEDMQETFVYPHAAN